MNLLTFLLLGLFATVALNRHLAQQRVRWLAQRLANCPIETTIQTLMEGYQRALGENDPERQAMVWRHLAPAEEQLARQVQQLATTLEREPAETTRISLLPLALPWAARWWPQATVGLAQLLATQVQGIQSVLADDALPAKRRAFTLMAEMMLIQHTCHWFCRSKTVASARLLARHQTSHDQVLDAVSTLTRQSYSALLLRG